MKLFSVGCRYCLKHTEKKEDYLQRVFVHPSPDFKTAIELTEECFRKNKYFDAEVIFCIEDDRLSISKDYAETCQYEKEECDRIPTNFAYSRYLHKIGAYCEIHAPIVAEESSPEYWDQCPLCGCEEGIN